MFSDEQLNGLEKCVSSAFSLNGTILNICSITGLAVKACSYDSNFVKTRYQQKAPYWCNCLSSLTPSHVEDFPAQPSSVRDSGAGKDRQASDGQ